ncbi:tRNA-specific adenosine deaminase 2 [Pancytospora philotis]|nr:tRNA-specific adenosine deaminase 2 [Pancytospora philotis]
MAEDREHSEERSSTPETIQNDKCHSMGDAACSTEQARNRFFMGEALAEARAALEENEVPVGCVLVADGEIVARSHNLTNARRNPLCHAEFIAALEYYSSTIGHSPAEAESASMGDMLRRLSACDSDKHSHASKKLVFYITVEPCVMCHGVLERIGATVYFGCYNEIFGTRKLLGACAGTCLEDPRAVDILKEFYGRENLLAPEDKRINKKNRSGDL